jgi:hypothetical protein
MTTVTDPDPWAISDPDEAQALPPNGELAPPPGFLRSGT